MTDDSSHTAKGVVGLLFTDELPSHRHTWSSASSISSSAFSGGRIPPIQPIDIAKLREEIRKEFIAEKKEKSSLKEPVKERMKRKLDQVLDKDETGE